MNQRKQERLQRMIALLQQDGRMQLTAISKALGIPTSTVFDYMKEIKQEYAFTIRRRDDFI